jgi:hypothetical protein
LKWRKFGIRKLFLAGVALLVAMQGWHHLRYGHFIGYGWDVDLMKRREDLGIPGVTTTYNVRLTNLTIHSLDFEGIKLPGGFVGSGVLLRTRIDRWDAGKGAWVTVDESKAWEEYPGARVTLKIKPLRSKYVWGWAAIAAGLNFKKGDKLRLVILSSATKREGEPGQHAFYTAPFFLQEERAHAPSADTN